MFKKFSLLIILLTFNTIVTFSQFSPKTKGLASFVRFNKTETYVVLTGRAELDDALKTSVKENWTLTKIHFIEEDSFLIVSKDRDKSFIYIHKMKKQGISKKIKIIALVNGGYDQKATYLSNTLAYISIDNDGYEANDLDVIYRLPNMIVQLENIVLTVKENNIIEKTELKVRDKMTKYYNKNCGIIKEKTLLIDKRYLSQKIISEKELLNLYKYNIELVSKEYITKAIKEKSTTYVYLVSSLNLYKINTVTDCETGKIIYVDFEEENKITHDLDKFFSRDDILQLVGHIKSGK